MGLIRGNLFLILGLLAACAGTQTDSTGPSAAGYAPVVAGTSELPGGAPAADFDDHPAHHSFVWVSMRAHRASGVIVRPGLVITTAHSLLRRDGTLRRGSILVTSPFGSSTRAQLLTYSHSYDLAVLAVPEHFGAPARLADERVRLGQELFAAGDHRRPRWLAGGQVRHTDVPTLHRFIPARTEQTVSMFAVSARTAIGYSGGPMVDAGSGLVYGITVGAVDFYPDPQNGGWRQEDVALAMHIVDVLEEMERLLAAPVWQTSAMEEGAATPPANE